MTDPTILIAKLETEIATHAHFTRPLPRKVISDVIAALREFQAYIQIQRPPHSAVEPDSTSSSTGAGND